MPNEAANIRAKIQAQWPSATLHSRSHQGLVCLQHPTDPLKFAFETKVGAKYYFDGIIDEAHEVDTDWVPGVSPSDDPWLWKAVKNDFHLYFGPGTTELDAGQIIRYVEPVSGEGITLQLQQLQWTNDLDQIDPIADPAHASATSIAENKITWEDGYGTGIDFTWVSATNQLVKWLHIDSLAALGGAPPQFIIDGGNPKLRLSLIFQISNQVDVYVDGQQWNERDKATTAERIEFRKGADTLWYFAKPRGHQTNTTEDEASEAPMSLAVEKTRPNLIVDVFADWSWIETAIFPIHLDVTIDNIQPAASADDARETATGAVSITSTQYNVDDRDKWIGIRWSGVTIPSGATVDTALLDIAIGSTTLDEPYLDLQFENSAAAAQFAETTNNISNRTLVGSAVVWGDGSDIAISAADNYLTENTPPITRPELKTNLQALVDSQSGLSSAAIVLTIRQNLSGVAQDDAQINQWDWTDGGSQGDKAPKLYVEYTEGGVIYDDSLVLAADGAIVIPAGTMVFNPTLLLDADASDQGQGPLEAGGNAQLNAEAVIAELGNLVIDAQLQMDTQATQAQAGGLTIEDAITLVTQASQSEQAFLTLTTLVSLLAEAQQFQLANQVHQAALTMAADSEQIEAATAVMEETLLMATQTEQLQTGGLTLEGLLNFAAQATLSTLGQKVLNLLISLEAQATQSTAATLVMNQLVSLLAEATAQELGNLVIGVQETFAAQATQAQVGGLELNELITLAVEAIQSQSGVIQTGAQEFTEYLTFATETTLTPLSTAELLASLTMATQVELSPAAQLVIQLAVTMAAQADMIETSEVILLELLTLAAQASVDATNVAEIAASLSLQVQADIQGLGNYVASQAILLGATADQAQQAGRIFTDLLTLSVASVLFQAEVELGNLLPDVLIATAETLLATRTVESQFGPYQAEKQ